MKPDTATSRVLVVDDDGFVREPHALSLIRSGFAVTWVSDRSEAISWLETTEFDAVVSSIELPRMDGLKLLQAVQRRFPSLPVILASESVNPQLLDLAVAWGARTILQKPVDPRELSAAVASSWQAPGSTSAPIALVREELMCVAQ